MTSAHVQTQSATFVQPRPEVRPGYTVRVHERIQEGNKERVQIFEGLVISVHKGATDTDHTITVRRIASGVGVEKVFSLHSPKIDKIEVKKVAKVRRAKLFFLRGRRGKAARLSERFTNAGEFNVALAPEPEPEVVEEDKEVASEKQDSSSEPTTEEVASVETEANEQQPEEAPEKTEEPAVEPEPKKEE